MTCEIVRWNGAVKKFILFDLSVRVCSILAFVYT